MARHTPKVHSKVKKASIAVLGLGGLGSSIAVQLARTGVGALHLIDFDVVEPSNLNRQHYSIKHLGMFKTKALQKQISEINPYVKVTVHNVKLTEKTLQITLKMTKLFARLLTSPNVRLWLLIQ